MRDESKDHGTVDESSSEQQIRESTNYTLIERKTGAVGLVLLGLTAGRQTKEQTWKHYACLNADIAFLVALLGFLYSDFYNV